jgi:hypothetical protein
MSISLSGYRIPRLLLATAVALLGVAAFSSAAQACSYPNAEQAFSHWNDNSYYELVPGGGFEGGGAGWTFEGGAEVVSGNESQFLNSPDDQYSLSLPYGATATSPPVCVDSSTPSFRLMAVNTGDAHSRLQVTVTYLLPEGASTRNASVRGDDEWAPTRALRLESNGNNELAARISFTPKDEGGAWQVDDLYIDPFARH